MKTEDIGSVSNIEGTSVLKKYRQKPYIKQIGSRCTTCSNVDCTSTCKMMVGAHVTDGKDAYLVPLCQSCNHNSNKEMMRLKPGRKIKYIGTLTSIQD